MSKRLTFSPQECNTILAALRFYQERGQCEPANRNEYIHAIATNCDSEISMDWRGVDTLCEKINS